MIVASCARYFCSQVVVVVDDGVAGLIVVVGH